VALFEYEVVRCKPRYNSARRSRHFYYFYSIFVAVTTQSFHISRDVLTFAANFFGEEAMVRREIGLMGPDVSELDPTHLFSGGVK